MAHFNVLVALLGFLALSFADQNSCNQCKDLVENGLALLNEKTKVTDLKEFLRQKCSYGRMYEEQCLYFAEHLDGIVMEIRPLMSDSEAFCQMIELCGSLDNTFTGHLSAAFGQKLMSEATGLATTQQCDSCKLAMQELAAAFQDKRTQAQITDSLNQLCELFGGPYAGKCKDAVATYMPEVFELLPAAIILGNPCAKLLKLCDEKLLLQASYLLDSRQYDSTLTAGQLENFKMVATNLQTKAGLNVGCVLCKMGLGGIINFLKLNDALLQSIADALQNVVCNLVLPKAYNEGCNDFIQHYMKTVLWLTLGEIDVPKVCEMIDACKEGNATQFNEVSDATLCEACEVAVEFLKFELADKNFQQAVIGEIKKVCNILPEETALECTSMVELYAPYIMSDLSSIMVDSNVCKEFHMCS